MSHEEYWDYLAGTWTAMEEFFKPYMFPKEFFLSVFKLTASPYHYWLENQAVFSPEQERITREEHALIPSSKASAEKGRVEDISHTTCAETSSTGPLNADASKRSSAGKEALETELRSGDGANVDRGEHRTKPPLETGDLSNLANKAQEIREKAKTCIREYGRTGEKQWPLKALEALWAIRDDWAKGQTLYMALDNIPDNELCLWNDKHGVFN